MESTSSGWRGKLAGFSLALSLFAVAWVAAAAFGSKFGWWSWKTGLGQMIGNVNQGYGRFIIAGAALIAVIALLLSLIKAPRKKPFILALFSLLIAGTILGRWLGFQASALGLPPIHDVQTDWSMPIMPTEGLIAKRKAEGAENPIEQAPVIPAEVDAVWKGFGNKSVAQAQEDAEFDSGKHKSPEDAVYPKLDSLVASTYYEDTFAAAHDVVKARGWEIITADPETGRIEATETSTFFGFKDDILIRVSMVDGYGVVDARSVSRVGLSDLGMNSKRVASLLEDIKTATETKAKAPAP
jgi:hypothetical protein